MAGGNFVNQKPGPLRLALVLTLATSLAWAWLVPVQPVSDSVAYDTFARNLVQGVGYGWDAGGLTAYWPPGTSFVYAALYWIFGTSSYLPIVVLNVLLRLGIVWLTHRQVRRWFGDPVAGVAALLLALWPSQVQFVTVLASELPFTFLMLLAMEAWAHPRLTSLPRVLAVGLVLGAAAHVRSLATLLPVLLLLARWREHGLHWRPLAEAVAVAAVIGLVGLPWSARNTQLFGAPAGLATNGGANLWMGNNPGSGGGYMDLPAEMLTRNEVERDQMLGDQAKAYILAEPLAFAQRAVRKAIVFHDRETIGVHWNEAGLRRIQGESLLAPLKWASQLFWLTMLALAVGGSVVLGRRLGWTGALLHPTLLLWGTFAAVHVVVVAQDRYHFPLIPVFAALAALALDALRQASRPSAVPSGTAGTPSH